METTLYQHCANVVQRFFDVVSRLFQRRAPTLYQRCATLKCWLGSDQYIVSLIFLTLSFKLSWHIIAILRSSRPEVFCKKDVLKHFAKFRGKQLCRILFFYKIAGRLLQVCRKEIAAHVFPYKICEIFKNIFF